MFKLESSLAHRECDCSWLYTQFLAIDANFRLKLKDRQIADVEIAPGWAYFVREDDYQRVITATVNEDEVMPFKKNLTHVAR